MAHWYYRLSALVQLPQSTNSVCFRAWRTFRTKANRGQDQNISDRNGFGRETVSAFWGRQEGVNGTGTVSAPSQRGQRILIIRPGLPDPLHIRAFDSKGYVRHFPPLSFSILKRRHSSTASPCFLIPSRLLGACAGGVQGSPSSDQK
jgi:hypothetical protein